jgi:hypothetical protein
VAAIAAALHLTRPKAPARFRDELVKISKFPPGVRGLPHARTDRPERLSGAFMSKRHSMKPLQDLPVPGVQKRY